MNRRAAGVLVIICMTVLPGVLGETLILEVMELVYSNERVITAPTQILIANSKFKYNYANKCDGLDLLMAVKENSIPVCFFDPQYRGILDKLSYGNEGVSRGMERSALPQMDEAAILAFINRISEVLIPSGHLFLWVDKFHLCTGVGGWLPDNMRLVDMIVWNKSRMGMGYRTRRQCEYCIIIQKLPVRAKGVWTIHNIPDIWEEKCGKGHPHGKPVGMQARLIEAVSNPGDIILDPAAGGFSVLQACRQTDRIFLGGDLVYGLD